MKLTALSTACLLASLGTASAAAPKAPNFSARRDYAGQGGLWVNAADTNGDGIPDLVLTDWQGSETLALFGNGDGTFRTGPTSPGLGAATNSIAIDLNGDSIIDLVTAGGVSGSSSALHGVSVCLGNGDGTFQAPITYAAGTDFLVGQVVLGDFNGDGILDAALNGSSGIWLFTGAGGGVFNPGVLVVPITAIYNGRMVAADFNNDGNLDLALTYGYGFDLFLGKGNGTFQPAKHFMAPGGGTIAAAALIPGGNQDVVLLGGTAGAYVLFGNGKAGFSAPKAVSLPYATTIAIGDVNGDGIPDLVSGGVYVALGDGKGGFSKPVFHAAQVLEGPYTVLVADLRKDGRNDIVTVDVAATSVLLNEGNRKFQDGDWTPVAGAGACGAAADFNGDGKPDLAVNTSTGVTILLGTGSAKSLFKAGTPITLAGAACLVTGDLNGDGIPDLLVPANGNPNALYAYLGNGDGTFTLKSTIQTPNSGGYIVLGDFNRDGKLDVATSDNLLALGNGDGTFQTPVPFVPNPPTDGFFYIAAGDINGDGWTDLVLDNWQEDYIYVLLNNQMGGYTQSVINPNLGAQLGPGPITLASLTPGGNVDMIYGGLVGAASIYLGDGKGGFTYSQTLDAADGLGPNDFSLPFTFVVADVNGDGIPDITLNESGTLGIFLGKGNGNFQLPTKYFGVGPEPGSLLVENLHGQSPTAGLPDIVAPDFFGGVTVIINTTK